MYISAGAVSLALQAVLDDPGFRIQSPLAANALQSAKSLQQWSQSEDKKGHFHEFSSQLVTELETVVLTLYAGKKKHENSTREDVGSIPHDSFISNFQG